MLRTRRIWLEIREALDADVWYWVAAALVLTGMSAALFLLCEEVVREASSVSQSCACAMAPTAQATPIPAVGAHSQRMTLYRARDGRLFEVPG